MPRLEGSCKCRAVTFAVESHTRYPFMRCYCSICRKCAGGGGYAVNIMAEAPTLVVAGEAPTASWQAELETDDGPETSPARRHFCATCGSALWVEDPRWPEWIYPFASAIDSALPAPPERVHMMLASKADWVEVPSGPADTHFPGYPEEAIIDWHRKRGLYEE